MGSTLRQRDPEQRRFGFKTRDSGHTARMILLLREAKKKTRDNGKDLKQASQKQMGGGVTAHGRQDPHSPVWSHQASPDDLEN